MRKFDRIYLGKLEQPELIADLQNFPCDPVGCSGMVSLRRYAKPHKVITKCKTDFTAALELARFTSTAWNHDGFNSKPKRQDALSVLKHAEKGASFACVQFASVFVQLCHAVGIPARVLQVQTRWPGLGSSGHGHVTAEYFDSQFGKWVWIDPQIHAYATHKMIPLSHNELAEIFVEGKRPKIHFTSRTLEYLKGERSGLKVLESFVKRYIWISRVGGLKAFYTNQDSRLSIGCKRNKVIPPITFQGFADKMPIYLPRKIFDAPLNACQLRIETLAPKNTIEWKGIEDYKRNGHKNYANGQIKVLLTHSVPWFSHYMVKYNGRSKKLKSDSVVLKLSKGANEIEVIPVNYFGREGMPSKATIHFDNRYKTVRSYW